MLDPEEIADYASSALKFVLFIFLVLLIGAIILGIVIGSSL